MFKTEKSGRKGAKEKRNRSAFLFLHLHVCKKSHTVGENSKVASKQGAIVLLGNCVDMTDIRGYKVQSSIGKEPNPARVFLRHDVWLCMKKAAYQQMTLTAACS
jgi:hypothetical protein